MRAVAICFVLLTVSRSLHAQTDAPAPRWSGGAEVSYVSTSGNSDTRSIGFGADALYQPGGWTLELKAAYIQSEAESLTTAERTTALAAYQRALTPRLGALGRVSYLRNEFAGLDSSMTADAGLTWKAMEGPKHLLELAGAAGYTWEERLDTFDRDFANVSAGSKYRWVISPTAEFTDDAIALVNVEDSDDWRLTNTAAIMARLTTLFSLKLANTLSHLNEPVPGFEKTDSVTTAALVARF